MYLNIFNDLQNKLIKGTTVTKVYFHFLSYTDSLTLSASIAFKDKTLKRMTAIMSDITVAILNCMTISKIIIFLNSATIGYR